MKEWRKREGLTQAEAAARVGFSQASWSDWENDRKVPRVEQALQLDDRTGGEVPVAAWRKAGLDASENRSRPAQRQRDQAVLNRAHVARSRSARR